MTVEESIDIAPPVRRGRRVLRAVLDAPTILIVLSMLTLVSAYVIRDRLVWIGWIMYAPLWPVGVAAVLWDLLRLGRSLPLRWLLLCLGLATTLLGVGAMWSPARPAETLAGGQAAMDLRVLQWNVQWGGTRGPASLNSLIGEILAREPDIALLSECPPVSYFKWALDPRSPGWNIAWSQNPGVYSYWYRMAVVTRWPVRVTGDWRLPNGHAALFEVAAPGRIIRVMLVDLESEPVVPRSPSLFGAARIMRRLTAAGAAPDIVAGDFNTPARFLGFDAIASTGEGYDRGSMWSGQWRGTWPSFVPLSPLDIDHVWVRRDIAVQRAAFFVNPDSDHRGQVVELRAVGGRQ